MPNVHGVPLIRKPPSSGRPIFLKKKSERPLEITAFQKRSTSVSAPNFLQNPTSKGNGQTPPLFCSVQNRVGVLIPI
jgi:hypothetical protein